MKINRKRRRAAAATAVVAGGGIKLETVKCILSGVAPLGLNKDVRARKLRWRTGRGRSSKKKKWYVILPSGWWCCISVSVKTSLFVSVYTLL